MERRGETEVLTNTIVQLLIISIVVGFIWFPYASKVLDKEVFRESAYATDNALLADSLFAITKGEAEITYPLADEEYLIELDSTWLRMSAKSGEGRGTTRPILADARVEVAQTVLTPRFFAWERRPARLAILSSSQQRLCPPIPQDIVWREQNVVATGEGTYRVAAAHALSNGLLEPDVLQGPLDTEAIFGLELLAGSAEHVEVLIGDGALAARAGCTIGAALLADQIDAEVETRPDVPGDRVQIRVPEGDGVQGVQAATERGLRRFKDGRI